MRNFCLAFTVLAALATPAGALSANKPRTPAILCDTQQQATMVALMQQSGASEGKAVTTVNRKMKAGCQKVDVLPRGLEQPLRRLMLHDKVYEIWLAVAPSYTGGRGLHWTYRYALTLAPMYGI